MSSPPITPEQLAALPPETRVVVEAIIQHYEQRIARLEAELAGFRKTPQNSSLPPDSQHPHAKPPAAKRKNKKQRGGQPGHPRGGPAWRCQAGAASPRRGFCFSVRRRCGVIR
ncbi:MAG: DUF6444 domain-containing protein [Planctomycetaceae bacterium]